ncbi:unnamed protein product [Adineta ricciae]|uniref:Uncharacterized protein n=1 Tax=Adineta ricciae TaxID=249248 RepID=A0A814NDF8_ADIRI|nr:unnamed protein product [Adineta ricciae]CAF1125843.1 unnamed protein product [Adineta ricciae]
MLPVNQNKSRANVFVCIALAVIGLTISTVVILSLIPVYLEDPSTAKSRSRRSVGEIFDGSSYVVEGWQIKRKRAAEQRHLPVANQSNTISRDVDCIHIVSNELNYKIVTHYSQSYRYYCFNWIAKRSQEVSSVSFTFNSDEKKYIYIDDITLNSTSNLIINGDFERSILNEWSCGDQSCSTNRVQNEVKSGQYTFRTHSALALKQLLSKSIESSGELYQLSFWMKSDCHPSNPCTVVVHIGAFIIL